MNWLPSKWSVRHVRTRLASVGAVLMVLLLTLACTAPQQSNSNSATSIVVAYAGPVNTLDPQQSGYGQTGQIVAALYDPLVTFTSDNKLKGVLATEYVLASDAKSVTITLQDGVTFHDGTPLTSEDVAFSLARYVKLGTGVANVLSSFKSTTIKDPTHLTINLKQPDSLFLDALSKAFVLNAAALKANAGSDDGQTWLGRHDAGSGPYQMSDTENATGNIAIDRFADYWSYADDRPTSIVFRQIDESPTQKAEVQAGNVQLALNITNKDVEALQGQQEITTAGVPVIQQAYIYFNTTTGPTKDPAVRQALQLAFDYDGVVSKILGGGQVATGPIPIGPSCVLDTPPYKQNLSEAKSILEKAGQSNLTLTMRVQPTIQWQAAIATAYQSDLSQIGVKLNLLPIAFPAYLSSLSDPKTIPQMMLLADNANIPTVGAILTQYYGPDSIGTNRSGYMDPAVFSLLDEAAGTSDTEVQCKAYEKAQRIIYDAATAVNIAVMPWPIAYSTELTNVNYSASANIVAIGDIRVK